MPGKKEGDRREDASHKQRVAKSGRRTRGQLLISPGMFETQEYPIPDPASTSSSSQQRHAAAESSTKRANPLPGRRKTIRTAQATGGDLLGEPSSTSSSSIASLHSSKQRKCQRAEGSVSRSKRQRTSAMADGDLSYIGIDLTEGEGREGGREERRGRVSTLKITGSVVDKWQPLSAGATKLLCDTMEAAIVPSLGDLSGRDRRRAENALHSIVQRTREKLASSKGPQSNRLRSYTSVKTQLEELVKECISVVDRNEDLENRLEGRTSQLHTLQEKVKEKQAEVATIVSKEVNESSSDDESQSLPSSDCEDDEYLDKLVCFLMKDRRAGSHSTATPP